MAIAAGTTRLAVRGRLDAEAVRAVYDLVDDVADADGVHPLSEHVTLHLRYGGDDPAKHVLVHDGDRLVGYAHLDATDPVEGASAELAVHPGSRREGIASAMVGALLEQATGGSLRLWAHGEHPEAAALAARFGLHRARVLWQMRRSLLAPLPQPQLPGGVTLRAFVPGQDEEAWIKVNARAFADLPDQGGWDLAALRNREGEPWFDPAGFFLAERVSGAGTLARSELIGFHWTKVHGAADEPAPTHTHSDGEIHRHSHAHEPIGEVYVVGVDPAAQGLGLGPALTLVGLRHLRAKGLRQAMLYVDETNPRAIHVYQGLGFARWSTDVCYAR